MTRKSLAFRRGAGTVGTLIAYDLVSGATQYQADRLMGRSQGYRVLGLNDGITAQGGGRMGSQGRTGVRAGW